jgi:hypothetical protein
MIESDNQLNQAIEQLGRMYRALRALREEVRPKSEQWFAVMAEGPLDEIAKLREEIEAYTGEAAAKELLAASSYHAE